MQKRTLGRSGFEVSPLGLGCWAIGGPQSRNGNPVGWSGVNDDESIRALQRAFELGITFFDTADIYGSGHSETLVAKALGSHRREFILASKAGYTYDERTGEALGENASPDYLRQACENSLRRLKTETIDLYQFHLGRYPIEKLPEVLGLFESLVTSGKVRSIGYSTDDPAKAELFAQSPACTAIQQMLNVVSGNRETLALCEKQGLASINRSPLAKGLLTGKFTAETKFAADDVRHSWNLQQGEQADQLRKLAAVRDILASDGRTPVQGAIAWLWGLSPITIPIPGFKSIAQVEENVAAMQFGPLTSDQMQEIDSILR